MVCGICNDEIVSDGFTAHPDHEHCFHVECIFTWLESRNLQLSRLSEESGELLTKPRCPLCTMLMENWKLEDYERICLDKIIQDTTEKMSPFTLRLHTQLLDSKNREIVLESLDLFRKHPSFDSQFRYKWYALEKLAELGLTGLFEEIFLTIEYKHIESYFLDKIVVAALKKRQVEFLKFVFDKGYIQAFDIIYEWGFATAIDEGIFEVVEYFLANRISSLCGPVKDYPRVASPQYHLCNCIEKSHPDILRLLLQNGYDQVKNDKDYDRTIHVSAFMDADPIYRQIILEYGFDFCTLENTRFVDSIEVSDFQAVKWMIEEAKCPHRETWVELKERAFEQGFEEIYYYLCEYLGETAVDPAIVKLTHSLLSESTEALVALVANGINIQALFPESSEMVKKVEMFEILKQSGCKVIPNIFIFCDALKINRLDFLEGMIESGLKIDSDLLQLFLDNYDTNRRIWSTRNIVDTFHKYGVKVTEYSKVWDLAFEEKNVKELDFLTRHSDTKRLFGNKYVLQRVFLKPDFDELTMLLLSMGYPIEAFDGLLFRILVGTCRVSLVVTIFNEHPTLDFYPFLPKVLALTHYEELQSNYFNVLVHPSKFTDQDVVDITKVILSKVAIPFFSKLESEGRSLDHQELLNVIAARTISPVEDTEFFEMFVEKYSDVDFDMQVPLFIAVTNGNDILVKYLTEHHPNKVEVSIAILSISRETENEFVMFVLQKYHQRNCELC